MQDNKSIIRDLFNKYFGTLILSELAFSVCTVIDGMLSGQYLGNDAIAAIGIKIVLKMSKHFEYTTTFRMNNVIITI